MNKLSVCILALNEQRNIKALLSSVQSLADEIIVVVDDNTTDKTADIAREFTSKVIIKKHEDNFHKNKQYTLEQATYDWILWMDGDESITSKLAIEIRTTLENPACTAYKIPRKNMMFGKWIEHTGWYPDYQIRLFRKSQTNFPCEHIHEDPKVNGKIGTFEHHIVHENYQSISHFIEKLNKYSTNDSIFNNKTHTYIDSDLLTKSMNEFCKRFIMWQGYKDGTYGLVLSQLQSMYELVMMSKVMELNNFNQASDSLSLDMVDKWMNQASKIWKWWYWEDKIRNENSGLLKLLYKIRRRIP